MKIRTTTDELVTQLQTASRIASTRSVLQALSGIKLTAEPNGKSELQATDMEIGIRVPLESTVERAGVAVLPARLFAEVARSLPGGEVSLELITADSVVEIVCGPATFHLRTLRSEDFPKLPEDDGSNRVRLPAEGFASTVERVERSASRDETRPVLNGILISASASELRMVATDSYRLSVKRTKLEEDLGTGFEANIPARAMGELARLAQAHQDSELTVGLGQNQVVFELAGVTLSSRLIDGQFPNYRQLIPEDVEHMLRLHKAEFGDVVRRVSLLAQKNAPLHLSFSEGALRISAETPDVGEASETLSVPFQGEQFDIGFNPDYLRDGIDSVEGEELVLKLISSLRPGLIESTEPGEFIYLIMPIRLNL